MLRKRGVEDVFQLRGGIHRYLEEYGDDGYFQGVNFVFDQRVTVKPSECKIRSPSNNEEITENSSGNKAKDVVVGRCIECESPFHEISGSRVCTVCRDLVLVCPTCQNSLREFHCRRHSEWKRSYFTFLDVFNTEELGRQKKLLISLRDEVYVPPSENRNVRRTLSRQIEKVTKRIQELESGAAMTDRNAPRKCRTCSEPTSVCDGCCWGFWRSRQSLWPAVEKRKLDSSGQIHLPIAIGDQVEPGPDWYPERLGPKTNSRGEVLRGVVVEIKPWGAGSEERDCVVVSWSDGGGGGESNCPAAAVEKVSRHRRPLRRRIYRWGVLALDGTRIYDVQKAV